MRPWYATNARDLLETRQHGLMPDGRVVVSLVGGYFDDVAAVTLYARQDMPVDRMDWRMLVNLDVWLWASPSAALQWLLSTASRIAHARPRSLVLRFEQGDDLHDVDIGSGFHIPAVRELPAVHEFSWFPVNNSATRVAEQLRWPLCDTHKPGTIL